MNSFNKKTKNNYDKLSKIYDFFSIFEKKYRERAINSLNIKHDERILEIGCGTGNNLIKLASLIGDDGIINGIDISEGMIDFSEKKIIKHKLQSKIKLEKADALDLHYDGNTFDLVFMSFVIELFPNELIPKIFSEAKRVLKKTGRICVVSLYKTDKPNIITKLYEYLHEKFPNIIDCRPLKIDSFIEKSFSIVDEEVLRMWGLFVKILKAVPKD